MNPRIRELAEQAEETYTYKDFGPNGGEVTKQSKTVNLEKFAELIVKECADIGNKAYSDIGRYGYIGEQIREHFGVE